MKIFRVSLLIAVLAAAVQFARAVTMIFPADAIEDLWLLSADDFRQKYSGINVTGLGPSDEGWYVRYRHENLTYLFGPLAEREEARRRKWDMEAVRDAAIRNRASLASSQVDFVRFTFSGVFGRRGEGGGGGTGDLARISADGRSGPDGDLDGDGIPNWQDEDMDGDGIPNSQDPDMDGDGIPNELDDYMYGTNPNAGGGQGGERDGQDGAQSIAGKAGSGEGSQGGEPGEAGQEGQEMGAGKQQGQRQVASQRGSRAGQQAGQQGDQSGSSGQQGQSSQSGQQSSQQSGQQGQSGQPGGPPPPPGSSGGSGNPLNIITMLMRMILGI